MSTTSIDVRAPALSSAGHAAPRTPAASGAEAQAHVLFLCTHNRARSQLAEGILRHLSYDRIKASSAGSEPSIIHPLSVRTLASMGIDASGQRSKHMDELAGQRFDYVVTVCDRVREVCPTFPGAPERLHWSLSDPTAVVGSEPALRMAFQQTARQLEMRIHQLITRIAASRRAER
ncbi:arsenate reductase ArsC [Sorangium sp. So ce726]|uniref:arsenate reductase ArsC n=1 Tax=Sorangium sp. So ce726 TaxID=3133319 RepID=UPI003F5D9988